MLTIRSRMGEQHMFEVELTLGDLDPDAVHVELYADGVGGGVALRREMALTRRMVGGSGANIYGAAVPTGRSPADYTPRVIPRREGVAVPLEVDLILWQR